MSDAPQLDRVVGVSGVVLTAFNCIVGVGIFSLPGLVAGVLGPAAIVAYLVYAVLIGLLGLCFAEAGSRVTGNGGLYAYAGAAFGPVVGGVAGALLLFAGSIGSAAALARFFLDTLASIWPALGGTAPSLALLVAFYGTLALVNIAGARDGARLTIMVGVLKLAPLLAIILFGVFAIEPANLAWHAPPPVGKVGEGAMILVLAFMGVEAGLGMSGETRDPARTIPRALLLALGGVVLLYVALQITAQGVLGAALAGSTAPLANVAGALFGPRGASLLLLATAVSIGGYRSPTCCLAAYRLRAGRGGAVAALARPRPSPPSHADRSDRPLCHGGGAGERIRVVPAARGADRRGRAGRLSHRLPRRAQPAREGRGSGGRTVRRAGRPADAIAAAGIIVWLLSTLERYELIAGGAFVLATTAIYAAREYIRRIDNPADPAASRAAR